jgi:predicted esterase
MSGEYAHLYKKEDGPPVTNIAELLADLSLDSLAPTLSGTTLTTLNSKLDEGRAALLSYLQESAALKLPERQKLVNRLSKLKRDGRLAPAEGGSGGSAPFPSGSPAAAAPPVDVSDSAATSTAAAPPPSLQPPPPPPKRDSSTPLRVLCLHAFRTNASILKLQMRMSGTLELLSGLVECTFLDAPYKCTPEDEAKQYDVVKEVFPKERHGGHYREWFNAVDVAKGDTGGPEYVQYAHYEGALEAVEHALKTASPPYDGLMGFSQGGSLAMWVATLQQRGRLSAGVPTLRFVWLQSARLPRDFSCKGLFDTVVSVPAFVTLAEDDDDVRPQETRNLIAKLPPESTLVVTRAKGGHGVMSKNAVSAAEQENIKSFFKKLL